MDVAKQGRREKTWRSLNREEDREDVEVAKQGKREKTWRSLNREEN